MIDRMQSQTLITQTRRSPLPLIAIHPILFRSIMQVARGGSGNIVIGVVAAAERNRREAS
jgi:hypothetical protein